MFHGHASRPPRWSRRAFTLAELLIVIAIIGVLISILLPTLGAARRSANSVKCLSSLRQLGSAYQMYAQDNHRYFPVAWYQPPATALPAGEPADRTWIDYHRREAINNITLKVDYEQFRGGSPVWGCPSFNTDVYYDPTVDVPGNSVVGPVKCKFNTGYGMSVYGMAPYAKADVDGADGLPSAKPGTATAPGNLAMIKAGSGAAIYGQFMKMETWGRKGATKCLVADANNFFIWAASNWDRTQPNDKKFVDPFIDGVWGRSGSRPGSTYIFVDGGRHLKPTASIRDVNAAHSINMLFVDGHASGVSPDEAYIAIRGAGVDVRTP